MLDVGDSILVSQIILIYISLVFEHLFLCMYDKAMAPHSSTLAWKIPWTEEPGRLQSMGSWRVGHDWAPSLSLFTFMHWRRTWQPTPVFLPGENPRDGGGWWAAIHGVAQSRTRLKRLSSSSSNRLYPTSQSNRYFSNFAFTVFYKHLWVCAYTVYSVRLCEV